jgi:hypothetical protein
MSRPHLLVVVSHLKSCGLVDRSGKGAILLIKSGSSANRFRFWAVSMLFHENSIRGFRGITPDAMTPQEYRSPAK